jgi:hypothetical protein
VADGTIIKLQDKLAKKFPGARQKAEFKIHIAIGLTGNTKSIGLFSCNTAEIKTGSQTPGLTIPCRPKVGHSGWPHRTRQVFCTGPSPAC